MTEKEVRDAVRGWLADITGITLIHSYQGGNEPPEPYGVLNMMISAPVYEQPFDQEFSSSGDGEAEEFEQTPVREWYWRFSLNVYGGEGKTILRKIKTAEHVPTALENLLPLTLFETSIIRDATELQNEVFQNRAQMDIEIRGILRDGLPIDVIEDAPLDFSRA